jgi:hypothetical protein
MWAPDSPMHADVDLLVVTSAELSRQEQKAEARLSEPEDQRTRAFLQRSLKDAVP